MKRPKKVPTKRSPTVDSLCKLGLAYGRLRRYEQAKEAFSRAIQLDPDQAGPIFQLGSLLVEAGDLPNALICHMRAVSLAPTSVPMRWALAKVLADTGRIDAAVEQYQQVLASCLVELSPVSTIELKAETLVRLGSAQSKQGKYTQAVESYQRALEAQPSLASVPSKLAYALFRSGRCEDSLECLERAVAEFPELYANHSSLVYAAHFSPRYSAEQLFELGRGWSERHARPLVEKRRAHSLDRSPERRLRVGYVSPDFRDHVQRL